MDVVFHAADFDGLHLVLPCDATQERPQSFAQCRRDQAATLFGAENVMEIGTNVRHANHSAVPSGLVQCGKHPGVETTLKRRAILRESLRDKAEVEFRKTICCGDVTTPLLPVAAVKMHRQESWCRWP